MKNLLSKSLLCGVIATSFLLINCQKAPNRPKSGPDAGATNNSKPQTIAGNCASKPEIATLNDERMALVNDLKALDAKAQTPSPNGPTLAPDATADREAATSKMSRLAEVVNQLSALIRQSAANGQTAESCSTKQQDRVVLEIQIASISLERDQMLKIVERITGSQVPVVIPGKLQNADRVKMSADMAGAMKDQANLSTEQAMGAKIISEGKLLDRSKFEEVKDKTVCLITGVDTNRSMDENTVLEVILAETKIVNNRQQADVKLNNAEKGMVAVKCIIAAQKALDEELFTALNGLVAKQAAQAAEPVTSEPSDQSTAEPNGDDLAGGAADDQAQADDQAAAGPASDDSSSPISSDPSSGDPSDPVSGDPSTPVSGDPTSGDSTTAAPRAASATHQQNLAQQQADARAALEAMNQAQQRNRAQ